MFDKFEELRQRILSEDRLQYELAQVWDKDVIDGGKLKSQSYYLYDNHEWFAPILDHILKELDNKYDVDIDKIYVDYSEAADEYVFYYEDEYICYGSAIGQVPIKALKRRNRAADIDMVIDLIIAPEEQQFKPLKVVSLKHRTKNIP